MGGAPTFTLESGAAQASAGGIATVGYLRLADSFSSAPHVVCETKRKVVHEDPRQDRPCGTMLYSSGREGEVGSDNNTIRYRWLTDEYPLHRDWYFFCGFLATVGCICVGSRVL